MLNFAMVLMILAGLFGLPAVACSGACAGMGAAADASQRADMAGGQKIMESLMWLALIASIGSIIVGALVKRLGKTVSLVSALIFAGMFASLILQMNILGLMSAGMLVLAAIMIFVAPAQQFRNVQAVVPAQSPSR